MFVYYSLLYLLLFQCYALNWKIANLWFLCSKFSVLLPIVLKYLHDACTTIQRSSSILAIVPFMVFKLRPCLLQLKGINVLWTYSSIGLVYFSSRESMFSGHTHLFLRESMFSGHTHLFILTCIHFIVSHIIWNV